MTVEVKLSKKTEVSFLGTGDWEEKANLVRPSPDLNNLSMIIL